MTDFAGENRPKRPNTTVHPNLPLTDILDVLAKFLAAYKFEVRPPQIETLENEIKSDIFTPEVQRSGPLSYYTDISLHDPDPSRPELLSQRDVIAFLRSIEIRIRKQELGDTNKISVEQKLLLDRIAYIAQNNLDIPKDDLKDYLDHFEKLLLRLASNEEPVDDQEKEPAEIVNGMPVELQLILNGAFNIEQDWPQVERILDDLRELNPNTVPQPEFVETLINGKPKAFQVIFARQFINEWLKSLYDVRVRQQFEAREVALPEVRYFIASNSGDPTATGYTDSPFWVDADVIVALYLSKNLTPAIKAFLDKKPTTAAAPQAGEVAASEGGENPIIKDDKPSDDDMKSMLEKFAAANVSYSQETARISRVLLPQLFKQHDFQGDFDFDALEQSNPELFGPIRREFNLELENVLRTLTPREYALLQEGSTVSFRMAVIRRLYPKLSTNPHFIGSLQRYKELALGQLPETSQRVLENKLNADDQSFFDKIEKYEKSLAAADDWAAGLKGSALENISNINAMTQSDLRKLLTFLSKEKLADSQFETLLQNLDVVLVEKWSPAQLLKLDPATLEAILGVTLPDELKSSEDFPKLLALCSEYLYAQRQAYANTLKLDTIARGEDGPFELDENGNEILSSRKLELLRQRQQEADKYKDRGGARSMLLARGLTPGEARDRELDHYDAVAEIQRQLDIERNVELAEEHRRRRFDFNSLSMQGRLDVLRQMGISDEMFQGNIDYDAQMALAQQLLDAEFARRAAEHEQDLQRLSYYERQSGVVRQGGVPQRFGSTVGSLAKGAFSVLGPLPDAIRRGNTLKIVSEMAKKVFDPEKALLYPVMGPIAESKTLRRGVLAGAAVVVGSTLNAFLNGGLVTKFMTGLGGLLGGAAGFGFGVATGGTGFIFIAPGSLIGSFIGANMGARIEGLFGKAAGGFSNPGLSLPSASAAPPLQPAAAGISQTVSSASSFANQVIIYGAPPVIIGATFIAGPAGLINNFQPPSFETLDAAGKQSQYLTLSKVASPSKANNLSAGGTQAITYTLEVQAKGTYQIEITGIKDVFSVRKKDGQAPPAPTGCENIIYESLPTKTVSGGDAISLGTCTITVDQQYNDTGIQNELTLDFNVTTPAGETITGESASTIALTCVGECPQSQGGDTWPTTGVLTQGPYPKTGQSHDIPGYEDAVDIGAPLGTPVYAVFPGEAFFLNASSPNAVAGAYGIHVLLKTDNGFALVNAHLARFRDGMSAGQSMRVEPCTLIGYVGSTGNSDGYHLHYEYRMMSGNRNFGTTGTGGRSLIGSVLPEPFKLGADVSNNCTAPK